MNEEVEVPKGVEVKLEKGLITVKGAKGECKRVFADPKVTIKVEKESVVVSAKSTTKREKTKVGSYAAHVKNMIKGASQGHVYKLKICSGHFPMNVAVTGKDFIVKNFLGEKHPRILKLKEGVKVTIDGEIITVEGCNKELAGQVAADIESLTRITNRDLRVFQDGIYMTNKDGKDIR
ncbi:50S ribosomal protein L6 [Candidatus Woesearchaeota archaeon]|nr:50S ribosomal protein L6 [Candidatus Woesearchaeota archaeon]